PPTRCSPSRQRHTARPMLAAAGRRLRRRVGLGRPLAATSPGLRRELTGGGACVTVPPGPPGGEEDRVDFGELWSGFDGTLPRVWLFVLRSGRLGQGDCMWRLPAGRPGAFGQGHVL